MGRLPKEWWKTPGVRWTKGEDELIRQHYQKHGSAGVLKALRKRDGPERSQGGVQKRAARLRIPYDATLVGRAKKRDRMVYAYEVHPQSERRSTQTHRRLAREAERDGVLTKAEVYPYRLMVPEWWADQYLKRVMQEYERAEWFQKNWIDTGQVARLFGFTRKTLQTYMGVRVRERDPRMANLTVYTHLDRIPREYIHSGIGFGAVTGTFWDPVVAKREAEAYGLRKFKRQTNLYVSPREKRSTADASTKASDSTRHS